MASHDARTFELKTPLGKDVLLLESMHGLEAMSQPFQWKLELLSEKGDVDPDDLLGQKLSVATSLPDGKKRFEWIGGKLVQRSAVTPGLEWTMSLLKDDSLYNNLNATLVHANSIMAEADQGKGALGLLTKDQAFANKLNDTVSRVDNIMTGIDKGEGTAGLLVKDPALYHNLDKLAVDSQSLVNTIRSDPKKYLTIHFKIF